MMKEINLSDEQLRQYVLQHHHIDLNSITDEMRGSQARFENHINRKIVDFELEIKVIKSKLSRLQMALVMIFSGFVAIYFK
ncbi:hypothetical protein [Vibrio mediterranei]|uniref:hypothetical protein n=1 Tax=Vibrio mediterranei TaxID=689 RepID=UPI00148CC0FD|nr:hypothetical protein [Vibrio mediterranei]NOI26381.1 hypothetical protein [Vibrio mediterranei]